MTPTTSKFKSALALLLMVSMMAPSLALAREVNEGPKGMDSARDKAEMRLASSTNSGVGGQNFCANIDKYIGQITAQRGTLGEKRDDRREKMDDKRDDRRGLKDGKLDDRRDDRDENRTDRYAKLYDRATTTAQTTAVDAFKAAVESAVVTRRTAVDAAMTAYRAGVDALITERKGQADAAQSTHKAAIDAAIAKAKADCTAGVDPQTVRQTLKDSLKAANDAFRLAVKPVGDTDAKVRALKVTRDAAIKTAMDAFKLAFDAALAALKTALGK